MRLKNVPAVLRLLRDHRWRRHLIQGIRLGRFPIFVDYPVQPAPRFGYGKPPHARLFDLLDAGREVWAERLTTFKRYAPQMRQIRLREPEGSLEPCWSNRWFSGLDAVALYSLIAANRPRRYLEIGSGNSTRFARRAIRDSGLDTRIVSIDPSPRLEVESIAQKVIRRPLEEVDLAIFAELEKDDILSFDGSHTCFMNSDVTVFFLEVLPELAPGVLVHVHDIHLPYDYPPARAQLFESEQYLLGVMLLSPDSGFEVVLPNRFIAEDAELAAIFADFWTFERPDIFDCSFWLRKR